MSSMMVNVIQRTIDWNRFPFLSLIQKTLFNFIKSKKYHPFCTFLVRIVDTGRNLLLQCWYQIEISCTGSQIGESVGRSYMQSGLNAPTTEQTPDPLKVRS
jgi:hypothetical protein